MSRFGFAKDRLAIQGGLKAAIRDFSKLDALQQATMLLDEIRAGDRILFDRPIEGGVVYSGFTDSYWPDFSEAT